MGQSQRGEGLDIIRLDIITPFDGRTGLRAPIERQGATRAGPQRQFIVRTGGLNQGNNIIAQTFIHMHLPHPFR